MRCVNPTDPVVGEPPDDPTGGEGGTHTPGGGFCGTGGKPVELPEWQKTYLDENIKNTHRLLYEVTKGIESQKVWRDLVWAEALGKDLASIDPRIKKIRIGDSPEEDSGSSWDNAHEKTIRVAMQLLFLDYIKANPGIRKMFTSVKPEEYTKATGTTPQVNVGWQHFRMRVATTLEIDFYYDAEIASEKAGRTVPEKPHHLDLPREPWWKTYERQARPKNPRVSYHDDYTNRDVYTAIPSHSHLKGMKNSQQIEIEPWLNKSQLPPIVADEMYVRDVARKPNGGARRCRNPWYWGASREGIGEVFWSKHKTPLLAGAQMMGRHAHRHLTVDGPYPFQEAAEEAAARGREFVSEVSGMPRPEGPGYQILGKRAGPRIYKENPWYLGYSRDGIKEVLWSRRKPTAKSHGVRYDLTSGPYRTQREAEAQTLGGSMEGGGFYQVIGRRAKPRSFHSYRGDPQCWPGHYEEFGYEWPPEGGRRQERGMNPRSMNPQDKAFALKHNIPASTWNDATFQRELRSYIERHGTYPRSVYRVRVPEGFPKYMSAWGKSPNVLYDAPQHSNKGKRIHHFGEDKGKGKKPWLVSSQEKGPRFLAYVGGEFEADGEWIRY